MASRVTRFQLNHAGMAELLKSDMVRAIVTPHAEKVMAAAKADPHDETGAYENSIHIEQATTDRVAVRVIASDRKAGILESRYGILSRAVGGGGGGGGSSRVRYTTRSGKTRWASEAQAAAWQKSRK